MPGGEALTVTLRSPRAPAGDPLLAERPARVAAEGAIPFRIERRDHNEIMLIRPQQAHEPPNFNWSVFYESIKILFVHKENKNNDFIQQFLLFCVSLRRVLESSTTHCMCIPLLSKLAEVESLK